MSSFVSRLGNVVKWWCFSWSFSSFGLLSDAASDCDGRGGGGRSRRYQLLFSHRNQKVPMAVSSCFCCRRSRCAWHAGWFPQFSSPFSWGGIITGPMFAHDSDLLGAFRQVAAPPRSEPKSQIYFSSEPQTNSTARQARVGRGPWFTEGEERLSACSFFSSIPVTWPDHSWASKCSPGCLELQGSDSALS